MIKSVTCAVFGAVLTAGLLPLAGRVQAVEALKIRFFSGLLDRDRTVSVRTASGAMQEQKERVAELLSLVERNDLDPSLGGPQHIAITLLGRYRSKDAVPALARRLMYLPDLKPGSKPMSETGITQMYYPCAAALVEIGQPSTVITEMSTKIQTANAPAERQLAAWVIMQIQGSAQALVSLEGFRTGASAEGGRKERLGAAKEYIENFEPTFNHPKAKVTESRPPLPPGL